MRWLLAVTGDAVGDCNSATGGLLLRKYVTADSPDAVAEGKVWPSYLRAAL